jgi:hypothetical protein
MVKKPAARPLWPLLGLRRGAAGGYGARGPWVPVPTCSRDLQLSTNRRPIQVESAVGAGMLAWLSGGVRGEGPRALAGGIGHLSETAPLARMAQVGRRVEVAECRLDFLGTRLEDGDSLQS